LKPEHVALAVKEVVELAPEVIEQRFGVSPADGATTEVLGEITGGLDGVGIVYTNKNSVSISIGANLAELAKHKIKPYDLIEAYKLHPMMRL